MNQNKFDEYVEVVESKYQQRAIQMWRDEFANCKTDVCKESILHIAAEYNLEELTSFLLQRGINVNVKDAYGWSPLHRAARYNRVAVAEILIKKGAHINVVDSKYGCSPLQYAACKNSVAVAEILIEKGADINLVTEDGLTALEFAEEEDNSECVSLLRKAQTELEMKEYKNLTFNGYVKIVKDKNEQKTRKMWKKEFRSKKTNDAKKESVLHIAAEYSVEMVKFFLGKAMNVNIENAVKQSPLHIAASCNNVEVAEKLIENNADINLVDKNGQTALQLAEMRNNAECVSLLRETQMKLDKSAMTSILQKMKNNENEEKLIELLGLIKSVSFVTEEQVKCIIIDHKRYKFMQCLILKFDDDSTFKITKSDIIFDLIKEHQYCLIMSVYEYITDDVINKITSELLYAAYKERNLARFNELCNLDNFQPNLFNGEDTILTRLIKEDEKPFTMRLTNAKFGRKLLQKTDSQNNLPFLLMIKKEWYNVFRVILKKTENVDEENNEGDSVVTILLKRLVKDRNSSAKENDIIMHIYKLIERNCNIYRKSPVTGKTPISYSGRYKGKFEHYFKMQSRKKKEYLESVAGDADASATKTNN